MVAKTFIPGVSRRAPKEGRVDPQTGQGHRNVRRRAAGTPDQQVTVKRQDVNQCLADHANPGHETCQTSGWRATESEASGATKEPSGWCRTHRRIGRPTWWAARSRGPARGGRSSISTAATRPDPFQLDLASWRAWAMWRGAGSEP